MPRPRLGPCSAVRALLLSPVWDVNKVHVSVRCPQQGPDCSERCPASVQILSGVSGPSWRLCPARRTTVTTVQWLCRRPQRRCRQGEKSRGQISDQFSSISLLFCGYTAAAAGSSVTEVKFRKHSKWGYSRSGGRVFPPWASRSRKWRRGQRRRVSWTPSLCTKCRHRQGWISSPRWTRRRGRGWVQEVTWPRVRAELTSRGQCWAPEVRVTSAWSAWSHVPRTSPCTAWGSPPTFQHSSSKPAAPSGRRRHNIQLFSFLHNIWWKCCQLRISTFHETFLWLLIMQKIILS